MKLAITVQGVQYEVDVQVLEEGNSAPATVAAPAMAAPSATPKPKPAPKAPAPAPAPAASTGGTANSPLAGNVLDVKVSVGDTVELNQPLLVLEAMKMETVIPSPQAGTVTAVMVKPGDGVTAGQPLVKF
jgi:biotin carboxyl carrier protein